MSGITITFATVGAMVVLFMWGRIPVAAVALGGALLLHGTGVLTLEQALAGFGNFTVLFIAALFVVSAGLEAGGVTSWVGQLLIRYAQTHSLPEPVAEAVWEKVLRMEGFRW